MTKMSSGEITDNPGEREQARKDFMLVKECDLLSATDPDEDLKSKSSSFIMKAKMKKREEYSGENSIDLITTTKKK
jgi:hypothetical protein